MERFKTMKFSISSPIQWRSAKIMCRWVPQILRSYWRNENNLIVTARALGYMGHTYDCTPGVFGVDCTLMYSIGICFEGLFDDPEQKPDEALSEELNLLITDLTEYNHENFVSVLRQLIEKMQAIAIPPSKVCKNLALELRSSGLKTALIEYSNGL